MRIAIPPRHSGAEAFYKLLHSAFKSFALSHERNATQVNLAYPSERRGPPGSCPATRAPVGWSIAEPGPGFPLLPSRGRFLIPPAAAESPICGRRPRSARSYGEWAPPRGGPSVCASPIMLQRTRLHVCLSILRCLQEPHKALLGAPAAPVGPRK